uniref:Uncharacterized protein n=1 Tax=Opuntia streptacantha TaxID=393608 RepID=A0A7C9EAF4_OPUST
MLLNLFVIKNKLCKRSLPQSTHPDNGDNRQFFLNIIAFQKHTSYLIFLFISTYNLFLWNERNGLLSPIYHVHPLLINDMLTEMKTGHVRCDLLQIRHNVLSLKQ